jgi:ribonuclease P/MRP protein subunit POP1
MPPKKNTASTAESSETKKRKDPPQSSSGSQKSAGKGRAVKRIKTQDARSILTQTADAALSNGELDVQSFLKSREFEIKALEDGMQKSKGARTTRAFQQVPRDMRRRTASHNVKRVPKRLQKRGAKEMKEDNTPTVTPSKRKPRSTRGRIRAETAKRLGILAAKKRKERAKAGGNTKETGRISTRAARPKIRKDKLNDPPKPKSKFRKRQIHKTWLPTHMWHTKRAKMTEPKKPLWRFSIPITSTEKSYRQTHRAGGARGAVAWDTSYMSTISLEGTSLSLEKVLKALGITERGLWEQRGEKWRTGKRSWSGWLSRNVKDQCLQIGPGTVIWCAAEPVDEALNVSKKQKQRIFIRIHPAAFFETWTELLRLSKQQRPAVHIEDLRFEIGSIEITGPGSTEALLGILHPYYQSEDTQEKHAQTFMSLVGVTNPSSLPSNTLLAFTILDPRLRYPPRPVAIPKFTDEETKISLLEMLSAWPADATLPSSALFDRDSRFKATRLPSQKSLNRRKSLAPPGAYASTTAADSPIPVMLLTSRSTSTGASQGTWTLLAPWKCILPIWYGLVHYPLSSGGNPRFGGIEELRQIHFEHGVPWFPADYPGTVSGFAWEEDERQIRKAEWDKRPKGKRVEWASLDLGAGRKGETGQGWACDFESVVGCVPLPDSEKSAEAAQDTQNKPEDQVACINIPIKHLQLKAFTSLLSSPNVDLPPNATVATVRITLVSRGVAMPCARIYRLPPLSSSPDLSTTSSLLASTRDQWLSLLPPTSNSKPPPNPKSKSSRNLTRIPLNTPLPQRVRLLAESLLQTPPMPYPAAAEEEDDHPLVPDQEDLIGFVTTGEFNLAEGKGVAIGTVVVSKIIEGLRRDGKKGAKEGRLCIVRNAGERIGRLARWEAV